MNEGPNPLDPKWDAKAFFAGLAAYPFTDAHPPSYLQPFLRVMLRVFEAGILNPGYRSYSLCGTTSFLRDRVFRCDTRGSPIGTWLFNRRVLNADWEQATSEEVRTAEAYLQGYTQLTVRWLEAGSAEYLDSFRNDVVYNGYRYNAKVWGCLEMSFFSCPIRRRLHYFTAAGGVKALNAIVTDPDQRFSITTTQILEFLAMVSQYWNQEMERDVVPYLSMFIVATFLKRDRDDKFHGYTYNWLPSAYDRNVRQAIMHVYESKGLQSSEDLLMHGMAAFVGRRNRCMRATIAFLGIHKYNRGYMRGLYPLARQVARIIWRTRRHARWFPSFYQVVLTMMMG
jgi:hypothetical protein